MHYELYNNSMRVISGKYRGKVLKSPKSDNIRPTGDKVKQALFTKLQFFVQDKVVLDLFSGSGALGIEAISHGAKKVFFVDKDSRSILLTKENLKGIVGDYKVMHCDYKTALLSIDQKIDLILVDPPYASGYYEDILQTIYEKDLLANDGIIVCEHPSTIEISFNNYNIEQKQYGTVKLSYFSKK